MSLSENIRKLRRERGWSQEYLAEKLGYKSFTTIQKWESGIAEPPIKKLKELSLLFDIDMDSIANSNSETKNPLAGPASKNVRINVYGRVPAGIPLEAIEDIVDWEEIPVEWTNGGQEYIALKVKGDSMSPKFLDGDTVIVRLQPDCENGQDCVVYINGYDATLKKVIKKADCVILQPLNPTYDPIIVDYNDSDKPFSILGVVVQLRRDF